MSTLAVENLHVKFGSVETVSGVSFSVRSGEVLGVVGESGSGKSVTISAVLGLVQLKHGRISAGRVLFDGIDLAQLREAELRRYRGRRIALVTQNPMTALSPVHPVGDQIAECAVFHLGLTSAAAKRRTLELMSAMQIPDAARVYSSYPFHLSGGLRQRIVIAMALAADPEFIFADEPTTALDVTVQAEILTLLHHMTRERNIGLLLITHDISVVAQICDRICVMYAGRAVEQGPVEEVLLRPRHPYTKALIRCIPRDNLARGTLPTIPGMIPSAGQYGSGCRFRQRCESATEACATVPVSMVTSAGVEIACHNPIGAP
ncbi:peptide/nickel transport system ATP-binding protein [Rhizobiales bacterium GAS191]|nr:peptide/nickel transport system ATP-binding protein [Rhizobiales bacterium GAS191]